MSAEVSTSAKLRATEPATLTLAVPAPLSASAPRLCVEFPPLLAIRAWSARPCEVVVPPEPMLAAFLTLARSIATAAPTPALPAPTASPDALARESVFAEDARVIGPPAIVLSWSAIEARELVVVIARAIAAATATLPSLVAAAGIAGPVAPAVPLFAAAAFARARCAASWLATPVPGAPGAAAPGAPAAEALA